MKSPGGSRRALGFLQAIFLTLGLCALGYVGFVFLDAHFYQQKVKQQFQANSASGGNTPAANINSMMPIADGTVFARIEIPRLKLDNVVIEGVSDSDLRRAVGHIPGTALPGNAGNVGVAGHRDTFFRPLRNIQTGDEIMLTTSRGSYEYRVKSTEVVKPERSDVLKPAPQPELTLVTCFPFYFVGSAPDRFIVHATEVGAPNPTPAQADQPAAARQNAGNAAGIVDHSGHSGH